ncbi:WD40 repeat domain-containing protein [Sulfurimonas sp.]|uniref:WD40 repeat domain-containing protein n=1 Tax=Sulfurimonas sp. TaxID=2022749 RepID=UPI00260A33FC|nr:WD40 repeat domain-containing protein [Sulfurimonas sp.]
MYSLEQLTSNLTAFNTTQKLLAIANDEQIDIYSQDNQLLKSIQTDEGSIEKIYFIPDTAYLLCSTKTGRVMIYNYKNKPFGSRLYSFVKQYKTQKQKKMTCAAFKDRRIAIASSEGIIMLIGLYSQEVQQKFKPTHSTISAMTFTNANKLISAEVQGDIFIHKLDNSQAMQTIHTALYAIKQLLSIPNTDFIIVYTGTNKLALLDIKSAKVVDFNYFNFAQDIAYIELTPEDNLLVILANKETKEIQLQQAKEIHSLILHNMIIEAYQLVEKEPWLKNTQEYNALEKIYFTQYLSATKALINADVQQAHNIMDAYLLTQSKKDDVTLLFNAYKEYERFKVLSNERKYAPAYALSDRYAPLKYSPQYKSMEADFKHAYMLAQRAIVKGKYTLAKEHLSPYLTVLSKKEILNLILKYNKDFLDFLAYIKEEDYENISKLLNKYPVFYEIPPYITLQEQAKSSLLEIKELINAADTTKALQKINRLQYIPTLRLELEQLRTDAIAVEQLLKNYEENNFRRCYEILDEQNHIFTNLELNKLLENHWKNLMQQCEQHALQGNVKAIKSTLRGLITVKTRSKQIGDLLRLGFRVEIAKKIQNLEYSSAEALIYSYIDIFGIDKELQNLMKKYEKDSYKTLALTTHKMHRLPRDAWLHNELIVANH